MKWQPIKTAPVIPLAEMGSTPMILTCVRGEDGLPRSIQTNKQVEGNGWLKWDDWTHWMELPVEFVEDKEQ